MAHNSRAAEGADSVIDASSLQKLKASLRGLVLVAGDQGYDAARRLML